eukprot:6309650-Alexandrium_andersonii.AAC.2
MGEGAWPTGGARAPSGSGGCSPAKVGLRPQLGRAGSSKVGTGAGGHRGPGRRWPGARAAELRARRR